MKFSEKWLREWVDIDISTDELSSQLTMGGLEVDGIESVADFTDVVVGQVVELWKHPDADTLNVAKINVGDDNFLQIVCGAKNIREGLKSPVSLVGAVLPGNFKIKKSKLRGVESQGMLCSVAELKLGEDTEGIMELPEDAPIGKSLVDVLSLDDCIIEVDLTPNRSDCLSIQGLAREVGVFNRVDVKTLPDPRFEIKSNQKLSVEVEDTKACPMFTGRIIEGINPQATTPLWMQEKLRRSGIRSLGPLVDVTNYVMLEMGQPMHAFDVSRIDEKIIIRTAKEGEKLILLDKKELILDEGTLLITDPKKPLALAGIMGGIDSSVNNQTTSIFLECAHFDPVSLAGVARSYGMHTEASHRFERGVDIDLQVRAINRATELLLNMVGGACGEITIVDNRPADKEPILLHQKKIKCLLGVDLADSEVEDILTRLGVKINKQPTGVWSATAPSFRFDINIEADLIEELGRVYGYNQIPTTHVQIPVHLPKNDESKRDTADIKMFFTARDYQEVISYSFVNPKTEAILGLINKAELLSNPISQDLSQMRTSLWSSLVGVASYNLNRQQKRVRLFETGLRFFRNDDDKLQQIPSCAGLVCGNRFDEHWNETNESIDFFDVKQDLDSLCKGNLTFETGTHPTLHPKQTAALKFRGNICGYLGKVHPKVSKELDLLGNTYLFELDLTALQSIIIPKFEMFSRLPEVSRDLALVVDESVASSDLIGAIKQVEKKRLKFVRIFDVYKGDGVDYGKQSLAVRITLQDKDKMLEEKDIECVVAKILKKLSGKFDAILRN